MNVRDRTAEFAMLLCFVLLAAGSIASAVLKPTEPGISVEMIELPGPATAEEIPLFPGAR